MTYQIPSWLTNAERVEGEPLSRHPSFHDGALDLDYSVIEDKLREALRAFDAMRAELKTSELYLAAANSNALAYKNRAENAEAECEKWHRCYDDESRRARQAEAECERLRKALDKADSLLNDLDDSLSENLP